VNAFARDSTPDPAPRIVAGEEIRLRLAKMTELPSADQQLGFLFRIQRILTEGAFESTYKFALLLSLADLAIERGDDDTAALALDTTDVAEKFIELYWRQALPWVGTPGETVRLFQRHGGETAILKRIARAREETGGSLPLFRASKAKWNRLVSDVAKTIQVMPLWKLQTIGGAKEDFLYPNIGRGHVIHLRGDAVYCLRQFYMLIADLVQTAWVRFVQRLARNQPLLGQVRDLRDFLFGSDRVALARYGRVLTDYQNGRCFYCNRPIRSIEVDHFIAWSRYPLDLGHNFVATDSSCNGDKCDRLPALRHLARWTERNADESLAADFDRAGLPHDRSATLRVAEWAYGTAERTNAQLWVAGRDDLEPLPANWRSQIGW
jgi:hypothetical protein